jgi:hypothetical protein
VRRRIHGTHVPDTLPEEVMSNKAKAIAAAIGTLATVVTGVYADNVLGTDEIGSLVAAIVTAGVTIYAVFQVPNKPLDDAT